LNLASCAEHDGKIALAWSRLKDARSLNLDTKSETRKKQIESFVNAAIARLEPRLPYLTVKLKASPAGVSVLRDGQPTAVDVELPIDPGKHDIEASAPGYKTLTKAVVSAEGARETITLELEPLPKGAPLLEPKGPPIERPAPLTAESAGRPATYRRHRGGWRRHRVARRDHCDGVMALGKQGDLDDLGCAELQNGNLGCSPGTADQASEISGDGATLALVSTVTTFVGASMVGAGVLMFVLGDSGPPSEKAGLKLRPAVTPDHASVWLTGSF
jgi:hypothetical protein